MDFDSSRMDWMDWMDWMDGMDGMDEVEMDYNNYVTIATDSPEAHSLVPSNTSTI